MDAKEARTVGFRMSMRSVVLAMVVLAVVIVPMAWSVRQSRLAQEALERAANTERAAREAQGNTVEAPRPLRGKAKILQDEALKRAAHRDPKDAERVGRLYSELDSLMNIQDRIEADLHALRRQMAAPPAAGTNMTPRAEPKTDPGTGSP